MIIWLNGPHRIGKTTTAALLAERNSGSLDSTDRGPVVCSEGASNCLPELLRRTINRVSKLATIRTA